MPLKEASLMIQRVSRSWYGISAGRISTSPELRVESLNMAVGGVDNVTGT